MKARRYSCERGANLLRLHGYLAWLKGLSSESTAVMAKSNCPGGLRHRSFFASSNPNVGSAWRGYFSEL